MSLRNISPLDIELALATTTRTTDHRHGTTSHCGQTLDGRAIVVVTEADDYDRIITVILDDHS